MRLQWLASGLIAAWTATASPGAMLWDNGGFDGRTGYGSMPPDWIADDFIFQAPGHINSVRADFYLYPHGAQFTLGDVAVWTEPVPGDGPGDLVFQQQLTIHTQKIGEYSWYDIVEVSVDDLALDLPAGGYFLGLRLVDKPYHGYFASWATAGNGEIHGHDGGWTYYDELGYPYWYRVTYNGLPTDFAFRLEGVPEPAMGVLVIVVAALGRRRLG